MLKAVTDATGLIGKFRQFFDCCRLQLL